LEKEENTGEKEGIFKAFRKSIGEYSLHPMNP
jgi:hypothetical protein